MRGLIHIALGVAIVLVCLASVPSYARAADTDSAGDAKSDSKVMAIAKKHKKEGQRSAIQLVVILAVASLLPALVLSCTCWVRFIIVFSFLRSGLGTQGAPPSQVLVGLSLFMTLFVMAPVALEINKAAVEPYLAGEMNEKQALSAGSPALRDFMLKRTRAKDLELFYEISKAERPDTPADVPMRIAIPSFILSELGTAFRMGLVILLPFLVIELIVAALLSALGMIMLPPPIVSLPIKVLVFVLVDGWHLVVGSLLRGVV